jgi:hypothetical protein
MFEKLATLAPVALILPIIGGGEALPPANDRSNLSEQQVPISETAKISGKRSALPARYSVPVYFQVRIEQRVIVRISPRASSARQSLLAELPAQAPPQQLVERKIGKCLAVRDIAAVQTGSGNRLLLFTRDRRIISAKLE